MGTEDKADCLQSGINMVDWWAALPSIMRHDFSINALNLLWMNICTWYGQTDILQTSMLLPKKSVIVKVHYIEDRGIYSTYGGF